MVRDLTYPVVITRRQRAAIWLVCAYRHRLSSRTPACVFCPTCSEYAALAIAKVGVVRGAWKTATRLWRCHGGNAGVVDFP